MDHVTLCEKKSGDMKRILIPSNGGVIVRQNSIEKMIQGKMECMRQRGWPAKTWFQDLKEWIMLEMADASQLATDVETWCELTRVTAAQIVPPDQREKEEERYI